MTFHSRSQAGQDRFVHALLPKTDGTFLEIGSNHPIEINNTFALEQLGWRGLLVDNDDVCAKLCRELRASPVLQADATQVDWESALLDAVTAGVPPFEFFTGPSRRVRIDYLSLDVDAATLATLLRMPLDFVKFNVITIEHDAYRFGPGPRDAMRQLLHAQGYLLLCGNVTDNGMAFEDWWIDRGAVDMKRWGPLWDPAIAGQPWQAIMERLPQ